ncbi:Adenine DNA glycosylase [Sinobacterium norvegicum]|uniref:Adenine DNA glycosylase n=1 Tax=Sinobacterium norvegicum TaxID=1641715 RepID=A0ABN8EPG3_9GAMM|nr:A/G-specific adenine glycosylase [Sinobacterium norvegicum]CAH0992902.1 Adenine DNA glycosylase [Sinobacterium norvegicum]
MSQNSPLDMLSDAEYFQQRTLAWFDDYGRKTLPWQQNITPYRVWLSEIMLQQTQVATVIDYFQRFTELLPTVQALAEAEEELVLSLWAGLGYYARARNLHKAAKQVVQQFSGDFPDTVEQLETLPGIGRSTAGAIVSIAFRKRAAILDGNVKRVLARYHRVEGWPGKAAVHKQLWQIAEHYTPDYRFHDYTQVMMDLGATVCTRSKPRCSDCPLKDDCEANRAGDPLSYPGKKPKQQIPVKTAKLLVIENDSGEVLLEKRPPTGIWGSLWSLPQCESDDDIIAFCADRLNLRVELVESMAQRRHTFSHYHLDFVPCRLRLLGHCDAVADQPLVWFSAERDVLGLPAPVTKLFEELALLP